MEAALLAQQLRQRAADYFPELRSEALEVRLLAERRRTNSAIYRFALVAPGRRRCVFVKVPAMRGGGRGSERPYLVPETDPAQKFRVQYAALRAVHEHFRALGDPRLGAVRPLGLLPGERAFAMEEVEGKPLRELLRRASRLGAWRAAELEPAFENAGAWLRAFHAMPADPALATVHAHREDLVELVRTVSRFLAKAIDDEPFFDEVVRATALAARAVLPESLPLGPRFGDFGLTNVLVDARNRVTGIDTLACFRAPIHEDIAYFLTGLETYRGRILSLGLGWGARVAALERAFLGGYFAGEPVPWPEIRLFEILRLLERWSAKLARNRTNAAGRLGVALLDRFSRRRVASLLAASRRP
jgi:hypothetical protein